MGLGFKYLEDGEMSGFNPGLHTIQAEYNAKNLEPVVFLKMNQCKPLVVVDAEYFIKNYGSP